MFDEKTHERLSQTVDAVCALAHAVNQQTDCLKSHSASVTKQDLKEMEKRIMAKIEDVLQDIADESTLEDSILALVQTIQSQLADALANVKVPADVQAKIDQAFATLESNKAKLTAAVAANTPAAPAVPAEPAAVIDPSTLPPA